MESRNTDNMNNVFIEGMKINIKNKIRESVQTECMIDIVFDENDMNIKNVIVDINEDEIENKKEEIIDIILKEIDIDKNLIIFK